MTQASSLEMDDRWRRLVETHRALLEATQDFWLGNSERVGILRRALRGRDRDTALWVAKSLNTEELKQLFPEWIHLARCAHGPFEPAWKIILSLPKDWVLNRIETQVDPILQNEEEDDYWMFLQLFERLDRNLTLRLASRAATHADANIKELGEDYLKKLAAATDEPHEDCRKKDQAVDGLTAL